MPTPLCTATYYAGRPGGQGGAKARLLGDWTPKKSGLPRSRAGQALGQTDLWEGPLAPSPQAWVVTPAAWPSVYVATPRLLSCLGSRETPTPLLWSRLGEGRGAGHTIQRQNSSS